MSSLFTIQIFSCFWDPKPILPRESVAEIRLVSRENKGHTSAKYNTNKAAGNTMQQLALARNESGENQRNTHVYPSMESIELAREY